MDLGTQLTAGALAQGCHEAWIRYRAAPRDIEACIARNAARPDDARLRQARGSDATLSALEDAFLDLLRAHQLPRPRTNIQRHGDIVDCWWPQRDLTVELISYRFHASRHAFEADVARRRRSNHLAFTWGDVFERPAATVTELRPRLVGR